MPARLDTSSDGNTIHDCPQLTAVKFKLQTAERDLSDLNHHYTELCERGVSAKSPQQLTMDLLKRVEEYKVLLRTEIDRKRAEIEMLECEERFWRRRQDAGLAPL